VEIYRLARAWARFPGVHEVIVCTIETPAVPNSKESDESVNVCWSDKIGRGFQMNRGAELATGDALLFHHADSVLTEAHADSITREMSDVKIVGCAFYRKFDERHPHLRWLEGPERSHSRLFGTLYGEQSIFVRHSHFKRLGGFANIPLMADVEFSKLSAAPATLPSSTRPCKPLHARIRRKVPGKLHSKTCFFSFYSSAASIRKGCTGGITPRNCSGESLPEPRRHEISPMTGFNQTSKVVRRDGNCTHECLKSDAAK